MPANLPVAAQPYPFAFDPPHCALVIIDMQRDFLEPGGFGEVLGNDVSLLRRTIEPNHLLLRRGVERGCLPSTPAKAIAPTSPICRRPSACAATGR